MCKQKQVQKRAAHWVKEKQINMCQVPAETEAKIWITSDMAVMWNSEGTELLEINMKCCSCWKLAPKLTKKFLSYKIQQKIVEKTKIRVKKLKKGTILLY